eukprot:CFRG2465T1
MSRTTYPSQHLIPKDETECSSFLKAHPTYDGRGVVVAVFDTGVDPAAAGMQITTDGKPKVIDIIDPTGSSDVDTSEIRTCDADGSLSLLSGRKMELPKCWKTDETTKFHVGIKRVYELCPAVLVKRLQQESREAFLKKHNVCLTEAVQAIHEWDSTHQASKSPSNQEERLRKEDLVDTKESLEAMAKDYTDCGPVLDCVVWWDVQKEIYVACIVQDTLKTLDDAKVMAEYKVNQEYGVISEATMINYSFNVYSQGNILSIVTTSGAHGTHVASILAAHHPSDPEMNGIAPGAQIISIKIGDTRLDGMETGTGIARGWVETILAKCDLVNMSFGEDAAVCNKGYITELANHAVQEHGVVFVTSAGNSGPALTSVTAPGGTTSEAISVGACVSQPMVDAEYCMPGSIDASTQYTWSSRGPGTDGAAGVTLSAPGGAVASVPNFTLNRSQLMNGTSMASPNACGGVALLLSALKQKELPYTPQAIKSCLVATCMPMKGVEPHAQGAGVIQVKKAFDAYAGSEAEQGYSMIHRQCGYSVECSYHGHHGRGGIYLRETYETAPATTTTSVKIKPFFSKSIANTLKVGFEVKLNLLCDAEWVRPPTHVVLNTAGRTFDVDIDMKLAREHLGPGVYASTVYGMNANSQSATPLPLFSIPVTIMIAHSNLVARMPTPTPKPFFATVVSEINSEECVDYSFPSIKYRPAHMERHVLSVPWGATWADVTVTVSSGAPGSSRVFVLHAQQLTPQKGHSTTEYKTRLPVKEGIPLVRSFQVAGGATLELCVAQFWASLGECVVSTSIEFHGITPNLECVALHGDDEVVRVDTRSILRPETIEPVVALKDIRQSYRPKSARLRPLPIEPRNTIPNKGPVYEIVLEYDFKQHEAEDSQITPRFPLLNGTLYESVYQSQLCVIIDKANRVWLWSDAFPSKCKLPKGDYVARLQVCSHDLTHLERLRNMLLVIDCKLPKDIKLDTYATFKAAVQKNSDNKFKKRSILKGQTVPVFICPPAADKLPKWARAGDTLVGSVTYGKSVDTAGCGKRPKGWTLVCHVAPVVTKEQEGDSRSPGPGPKMLDLDTMDKSDTSGNVPASESIVEDAFAMSVRDHMVKLLPDEYKKNKDVGLKIYNDLVSKHSTHLPLYAVWLNALDSVQYKDTISVCLPSPDVSELSKDTQPTETSEEVIKCADELLNRIDQHSLAAYFGMTQEKDDPKKKEMNSQKTMLVDALFRKARAYAALISNGKDCKRDFEDTFELLSKWISEKDKEANKRDILIIVYHVINARYGSAVKIAQKVMKDNINGDLGRRLSLYIREVLYAHLNWEHLQEHESQAVYRNLPAAFPLM